MLLHKRVVEEFVEPIGVRPGIPLQELPFCLIIVAEVEVIGCRILAYTPPFGRLETSA
jgi:hypothetical protein